MTVTFRPGVRVNLPLLLGVVGGTGSGKTFSAMRLASGIAAGKPFAVIDTENGRALHYADQFKFDHTELKAPFRPSAYADAIKTADDAGYPVILVDSASHEWAGDGGCLDWHEQEMRGEESRKMTAWIKPKADHRHMMNTLLAVRAHVILCFRAEEKIDIVRKPGGGIEIVPKRSLKGLDGWTPISEKNLPYELTASLLLLADKPGVPKPIKLEEQHRPMVPLDAPLTEQVGERLAAWAAGDKSGSQDAALVAQLLAVASERDNLAAVEQAIEKHAAKSTPAVHSRWLASQLARLTETVSV